MSANFSVSARLSAKSPSTKSEESAHKPRFVVTQMFHPVGKGGKKMVESFLLGVRSGEDTQLTPAEKGRLLETFDVSVGGQVNRSHFNSFRLLEPPKKGYSWYWLCPASIADFSEIEAALKVILLPAKKERAVAARQSTIEKPKSKTKAPAKEVAEAFFG